MDSNGETIAGIGRELPSLRELIETARRVEPDPVSAHLAARPLERRLVSWLGVLASVGLVGGAGALALELGALLGG